MQRNRLSAIFLIVFIDLLGFGLILPLVPYYADTYGASATVVGLLVGSYAAAQLIGAPWLGRLSDRYGRRPVLLVSIMGTFVGFLLLGIAEPLGKFIANSLPAQLPGNDISALENTTILMILFLSRILDGLTGGNISVAQAYITDVTDEENRVKGLGLLGAAFGLGFIIGPALGGTLSTGGRYALPALVAAALSFMNLTAVYLWLPESLTEAKRAEIARRPRSTFGPRALRQALNRPRVGPLLHIRFFYGLAFSTFTGIFALYAQYRLGLESNETGYVLAYVGILIVLVQGVAVGRLATRFTENRLIFNSTILMAFGLLAWAFAPSVPVLLIVLFPIALAGGVLNTVLNSALTKAVYPEEVGGTLGLSTSLESLTRVIAPSTGGLLIDKSGTWAPGVFGAVIMLWVIAFTLRRLIVNPDPPLPKRSDERIAGDIAQAHL